MKTVIIIAFMCCLSLALAIAEKTKCITTEDCGKGECCMVAHSYAAGVCNKLKLKDQLCFPNDEWNREHRDKFAIYRFMCPCVEGLECKPAEVKKENGVTTYVDAKCGAA